MNCLCCGKPLKVDTISNWHTSCVKRFFGTKDVPKIDLSQAALERLVTETVHKGYTVTGVQKKLSLHLTEDEQPRLTIVNYPTGYILKPQVAEYPFLPEAEQMVMTMADRVGIATVPHALIRVGGLLAYITKRVDRVSTEAGKTEKLAMEDFCQLDHRLTQDKYRGSYERCAKVIDRYSSRAQFDKTELFARLVFSYLVGNSDMHLKNFSLIESETQGGKYVLSPAYDLLPVQTILSEDQEEFGLTMNGKKTHLRRKDFLLFAQSVDIPEKVAAAIIAKMVRSAEKLRACAQQSLLPDKMKMDFLSLMEERVDKLAVL